MTLNASAQGPICIIGMHRSGTSMVARLLNLCGLDLGPADQLESASDSNPLGHYEPKSVMRINDALLARFGGSWDHPPSLPDGWESNPSLEPLAAEARAFIDGVQKSHCWGWKEPRTTLLLPFWKALVANPRFVICVRSPIEVAKSLATRDHIPLEMGVYLWHRYMQAAIRYTEDGPRLFTFYEDYFRETEEEVARLLDFCGLATPDNPAVISEAVVEALQHQRSDTSELLDDKRAGAESKLFYLGLRSLTREQRIRPDGGSPREDVVSQQIGKLSGLIEDLHDEEEIVSLKAILVEKDLQARQKDIQIKQKDMQIDQRNASISWLEATVRGQEEALTRIYASLGWKLLMWLGRVVDTLLPRESRRRRIYDKLLRSIR